MKKSILKIIFILLSICLFYGCSNMDFFNKPIPFDKDKWVECGGFDGRYFVGDDIFVKGNTRYKMSLWLEKEYNFCNKSLNDILEKFYIIPEHFMKYDSLYFEQIKNDKVLNVITKQYNPNFIFGIDSWINTNWIEILFDDSYMVSKVYYVHYDRATMQETKREICVNCVGSGRLAIGVTIAEL